MKGSLNKGFFTYLALFVGLIIAVFLVLVTIMLFSPGTAIFGLAYIKNRDSYIIKTYNGQDNTVVLDAQGNQVDPAQDPAYLNLTDLKTLKIVANNFDIDVKTGDLTHIEVSNSVMAVTKVDDTTNNFKVYKQYNSSDKSLKIELTDPNYSITLKDNRKITVFLTEEDYSNLSLEFTTKKGDFSFGGSNGDEYKTHTFKNITAKTEEGNIGISKYCKVAHFSNVEISTLKGDVSISETWGEQVLNTPLILLTNLSITANKGKITTGDIFTAVLNLNGEFTDVEMGNLANLDPFKTALNLNIQSGVINFGNIQGNLVDNEGKVKNVKLTVKSVEGNVNIPSSTKSDIVFDCIKGDAIIKTEEGSVTVKDIHGITDITTKSGKVSVLINEQNDKNVSIKTEKGDVKVFFQSVKNNNVITATKGDINVVYTEGLVFKLVATGGKVVLKNQNQTHEDTTITGYPNNGDAEIQTSNFLTMQTEKTINIEKKASVQWEK